MSSEHCWVDSRSARLHAVSQGDGPLVIFCHGFPGLWYSWRHQLGVVAEAGLRAVALDMRGYGRSDRPSGAAAYSFDRQVEDLLATMEHFGEQKAVIVGHDFGANLAWHFAVRYPERVRGVASLSVPYAMELAGGGDVRPSEIFAMIAREHFFHMHYFQSPGVAENEFRGRERELLEKLFWALSAEGNLLSWQNFPSEGTGYLDVLASPKAAPPWPWLSAEDLDYYVDEYLSAGQELAFAGGLNAYRVLDSNWQINKPYHEKPVLPPALFLIGERDPVLALSGPEALDNMKRLVKDLRGCHVVPAAGHFVQQEQAAQTNALLLDFIKTL